MSKDLFSLHREKMIEKEAPLAARMRPRNLEEFIGQEHIIGPGRLLRRAIQADQLSSLIFYGPPGTGKTTLARVIANSTKAHFAALNAVLAGVKNIREAIHEAKLRRGEQGQRTILFIDEVHRFNKAQQDALLPWVENGTVIFIGATTENPFFEVNKALVSRSRIFQLLPLDEDALRAVLEQAIQHKSRGYGHLQVVIDEDATEHLLRISNGDARTLLNALELAVETTEKSRDSQVHITLDIAEESIQTKAVLYDKEGDTHFDTISAFIKSIRGSDPDAALYWLAKMDVAGEDPRYIFRRLLILASEDIGLADPNAITIVHACASTFDRVGMPEGRFHLAQATLYLCAAKKSNSTLGYFDALKVVREERDDDVPNHLKDATRDKKGFGHGQGYSYPHAFKDHWVAQQYLPTSFQGRVFYQPSDQGWEGQVQEKVSQQREAQLAVLLEESTTTFENLTFSNTDKRREQWLQRSLSKVGQKFEKIRDILFEGLPIRRHHLVLDINAQSGLVTWEAMRKAPEGGVFSVCFHEQHEVSMKEQVSSFPEIQKPIILNSEIARISESIEKVENAAKFDIILGRNCLTKASNIKKLIEDLKNYSTPETVCRFVEVFPQHGAKITELLDSNAISSQQKEQLRFGEENIYQELQLPEPSQVTNILRDVATITSISHKKLEADFLYTDDFHNRLFWSPELSSSFGSLLSQHIEKELLQKFEHNMKTTYRNKVTPWFNHFVCFEFRF